MLHFGGRIAFRMDVRDFFQLQSAFQRYGITVTASQIDKIVCVSEDFGKLRYTVVQLQHLFHLSGNLSEFPHYGEVLRFINRTLLPCKSQCQHGEHSYLTCKGFGGRHTYFRPYMNVRPRIRSARILEPIALQMPYINAPRLLASSMAASVSAVSPLCEMAITTSLLSITRVPVTKFRSILHFHRNAAETLYQMFAYKRSVPRRATSHNYKNVWQQADVPYNL